MQQRPFSQRMAQRANPGGDLVSNATPAAGLRSGAAIAAGLLWLAASLSAGYWFLQIKGHSAWTPVQGLAPSAPQADADSVARALGALAPAIQAEVAPAAPARLQLLGVVVQGRALGAALIAVDGQPPRPWRVGATLADGLVLQSIDRRSVRLGESRTGPSTLELEMPPQPTDEAAGAAG